jgi:outer membrane protein TolC
MKNLLNVSLLVALAAGPLVAQTQPPPLQLVQPGGPAAPPIVMTLRDALERAQKINTEYQTARTEVQLASEELSQAKVALRPVFSGTSQYLGTQGNGITPNGRFVTNDGVHVYRDWAIMHEDVSPNGLMKTGVQRAQAAQALAAAKVEIAQRGLAATVTKNYYDLVVAQRRYAQTQEANEQSRHFLEVAQQAERLGQGAHNDVVKADIQYQHQRQAYQESLVAIDKARLNLAVLLSPDLNENFTVVDDLDSPQPLPPFADVREMALHQNPDLRAAEEAVSQAHVDVRIAKNALLPTLSVDLNYGIEANAFALHSTAAAFPEAGVLPNLGYFVTAALNIPVFDWGALRSKQRQAELHVQQAQVQATQAQRQLVTNMYAYYNEALAARAEVDQLRHTIDLATESLRISTRRFEAGEALALEIVDAQNELIQDRNAYDDAQSRYRNALATLQTLTGAF